MFIFILSACMIENGFHHQDVPNSGVREETEDYTVGIDSLIEEEDKEETPAQTNTITTDPCAETETVVWNVEFPQTQGCMWNEDGNLSPAEAHIQARAEQLKTYNLENGKEICDEKIE